MKVIIVEPDARPRVADIQSDLENLQSIVGGTIQGLYPFDDPVGIICNDEGKILGLPINRALRDDNGEIYDILCGTHVWDMSMVSGEGWKGTNISDLMKAIPNDGRKHIVFMDEFCKFTNHRNSDVAYHLNVQGNLLRLFEHDASMYKGACSPENITFVAMGAFENIYAKKKKKRNLSASQALLMKSQMNI